MILLACHRDQSGESGGIGGPEVMAGNLDAGRIWRFSLNDD